MSSDQQEQEHDHRVLAARQDWLHFQEEAAGMVFWHPRGYRVYRALESAILAIFERDGYEQVRTPQILRRSVWAASGHLEHFAENMFFIEADGEPSAVKPVSCPGHLEIVRRMAPSYRDLPLRLAELGVVHRKEPSGTLHGLFRLRQFTQDDGHILCEPAHIAGEVTRFCRSLAEFYRALGFERFEVAFATRPASRAGSEQAWDQAEAWLLQSAQAAGLSPQSAPGSGAFYGPKLEFSLQDRLSRHWQCGTIQLDLVLPERFGVVYVDRDGQRRRPALLHRALVGSLERMLGVLLEHHGGRLPDWLAAEQVVVLPISEAQLGSARELCSSLERAGLRARLAADNATLSRRLRDAHELGIPYAAIIGEREARERTLTLRDASGQRTLSREDAAQELARACALPLVPRNGVPGH